MKTVGVLGIGEVGSAIKKLASKNFTVYTRDLDHDNFKGKEINVLHLCVPYNSKFTSIAIKTIKELKPKLIIINSTVKPGTTRKIYQKTKVPIAHVPIMGIHPHLAKYQKTFTKMIGPVNDQSYQLARTHWRKLGTTKIIRFNGPEETELGKILSTTYYGWNIIFNKAAKKICQQTNTNFNQVYTKFNQIYNSGYLKTKPNVVRPVLDYTPGKIGGHCVIPNAEIMKSSPEQIFKWLLKFNQALANED